MQYYICLTGDKVKKYEDEKITVFDKKIFEDLLIDSITLDWIKDPVVMNNNIYNRDSLIQWLRKSNKDPLNGIELTNDVNVYPINIIKYLLFCLEEKEDKIIYHSPPNDILFAQFIVTKLPHKKYKHLDETDIMEISIVDYMQSFKNYHNYDRNLNCIDFTNIKEKLDLSDKIFTNCKFREDQILQLKNCVIENNINHYSIVEYLLACNICGRLNHNKMITITEKGYIIFHELINNKCARVLNDYHLQYYLDHIGFENRMNCSNVIMRFCEIFKYNIIINNYRPMYIYHNTFYNLKKKKDKDSTLISAQSAEEIMYTKVLDYRKLIENNKTLKYTLKKISKAVNNGRISIRYKKCPITKLRKVLKVPFIIEKGIYSKDLSMLNLSYKEFHGHDFKYYCFAGSDLSGTKFMNCTFSACSFAGSNFDSTKFLNCKFLYRKKFYKVDNLNKLNFINCRFEYNY